MNTSSFLKRKEKLNPEQLHAVETMEGPVLVVAGPGTGKTETLGARIANILHTQSDIHSGNILCLTYTNAGVVAMRKRLLEFIGPDAHSIEIHTFHSFCNKIIQENPDHFSTSDSENSSELEQYEIIESILENLPATDPHFQKNSFSYAKNLLGLFSVFKGEKWEEKTVLEAIELYWNDLPNREEFQYKRKHTDKKTGKVYVKGDAKESALIETRRKLDKLVSAVHIFTEYKRVMTEKQMYDFQDMILWILSAFSKDSAFLAEYQEQFQYILVDEFQDTNGSQKELIDQLCGYWDEPNIFVVGDDDQSIYRFQGANMKNIMDFYAQYSESISVVTLDKNYRSSQEILSLSQHVIERNEERLEKEIEGLSKSLTASHPRFAEEDKTPPSLREYYNEYHEDLGIFKRITALQQRGETLSNIAVIYSNHSQADRLIQLCESHNIPVRVKETQNILELPIVQQIINLLTYFHKESTLPFSGESLLFSSFFYPFLSLPSSEITALALERKKQMQEQSTRDIYFKALMGEEETSDAMKKYGEILLSLEQRFQTLPFLPFIEALFSETGLIQWVLNQNERGFLLRSVSTFFHFVKDQAAKENGYGVEQLLDTIQRMNAHGLKIPIEKIQYEKEGVNFITAHSSKGLEFEYVFVKGVNKRVWDSAQKQNYHMPDTLTMANDGDHIEEKRRLFFVALTRAKKFAEVSYSKYDYNGKELDSSVFIAQMKEVIPPSSVEYSEEEIEELQSIELLPVPEKERVLLDSSFLESVLENYALSPTHLNKYLQCKRAFFFENLLQIPASMPAPAIFGNAVHSAMEQVFRGAQKTGVYEKSIMEEAFAAVLKKEKYLITDGEYKKYSAYGKEILDRYYTDFLSGKELHNKTYIEQSISTGLGNVPIKGKLDKMEVVSQSEIVVTDYKTGNALSPFTKEKLLPPSEKNNFQGGDYWRQMVFYSLLIEKSPQYPYVLKSGIFDFIEPQNNEFHPYTVRMDEEAKQVVTQQIENVYASIVAGDFDGCGENDCTWCG